jgi:hypothetical protein
MGDLGGEMNEWADERRRIGDEVEKCKILRKMRKGPYSGKIFMKENKQSKRGIAIWKM